MIDRERFNTTESTERKKEHLIFKIGSCNLVVDSEETDMLYPEESGGFTRGVEVNNIELTSPAGEKISLKELLPDGWKIVVNPFIRDTPNADPKEQLITLPELKNQSYFEDPERLIDFLHEIGHTQHPRFKNLPTDHDERLKHLKENPTNEKQKKLEERFSWNFAVRTLRDLRRRGFDLKYSNKIIKHHLDNLSSYNARRSIKSG